MVHVLDNGIVAPQGGDAVVYVELGGNVVEGGGGDLDGVAVSSSGLLLPRNAVRPKFELPDVIQDFTLSQHLFNVGDTCQRA